MWTRTRYSDASSRRRGLARPAAVVTLAAAALLTGCGEADPSEGDGATDQAEPAPDARQLTLVSFTAPDAPEQVALDWWADEIEERTGGAVVFERFPQEALCQGPEITECVRDGRADFGMTVTGYTPSEFPIAEIWSVPFLSTDLQAVTQAHMALLEESESFQREMEDIGLEAFVFLPSDRALLNFNEPITDHGDLAGKSVRAVGLAAEALSAAGANPVATTASEVYEAAQRGVVDGFVMNLAGNATYSLFEVSTHWYDAGMGVYAGLGVFGNPGVLDDLPDDVREVIDEVTQEWIDGRGIELIDETQQASCDTILEADSLEVWERWDDADVAAFEEVVGDGPRSSWIAEAEAQGVDDAAALFDRYVELLAEFERDVDYVVESCAEQVS